MRKKDMYLKEMASTNFIQLGNMENIYELMYVVLGIGLSAAFLLALRERFRRLQKIQTLFKDMNVGRISSFDTFEYETGSVNGKVIYLDGEKVNYHIILDQSSPYVVDLYIKKKGQKARELEQLILDKQEYETVILTLKNRFV